MKHLFLTADGILKARWQEAFPGAAVLTPDSGLGAVDTGDVVWLVTTVNAWQTLIGTITQKGAVVVVLSYAADDREALQALDHGARGYAHTLSAPAMLEQVALVVTNHGIWAGQSLLSRVLGGSAQALQQRSGGERGLSNQHLALLTERERAVAQAVSSGASNKEIARQLDISERTVKAHLSAIFKKLAVRDRLQLMLKLAADAEARSFG
ncbi:helix-turn-helix domain-containing protein [Vreelandella sp. GE22]